jgi:hypothetical protein
VPLPLAAMKFSRHCMELQRANSIAKALLTEDTTGISKVPVLYMAGKHAAPI